MTPRASNGDGCPRGGLMHEAGECAWCDQMRADEYRDELWKDIKRAAYEAKVRQMEGGNQNDERRR